MLGAFVDGLFKGLEFHEKLYDVKRKKLYTKAAEEYMNQGKDDDTRAPLPTGKKLDGKTDVPSYGKTGIIHEDPATATPQTTSATAADESRSARAPKSTSQKLKDQVTDGSLEGDITMGRPYTGMAIPSGVGMALDATQNMGYPPVPFGTAVGLDASQNMGGSPLRSTGVFRPSTVADYRPRTPTPNPWIYDKVGAGLNALGWQVRTPWFAQSGSEAPAAESPPVWGQPRQPGSTLVDPDQFDPYKRP